MIFLYNSFMVFKSLRTKILFSVLICFIAIGIPSMILLYSYMNNVTYRQVNAINGQLIEKEADQIDSLLEDLIDSVAWISQNEAVKEAMEISSLNTQAGKLKMIEAQNNVSTYISATSFWPYLNKIVIFNENDIFFEYTRSRNGSLNDIELIRNSNNFSSMSFQNGTIVQIAPTTTINTPKENAIAAIGKIEGDSTAWIYAEINDTIFDRLLLESPINSIYIHTNQWTLPDSIPEELLSSSYVKNEVKLSHGDISILFFVQKTQLQLTSFYGFTIFLIIIVAGIVLALTLGGLITHIITRPTAHLVKHIEFLTKENKYGVINKEIEKGSDEIAQIGRTINKMSVSIDALLDSNERLFEEKKNKELEMLQMQVNPHFLYNTLESIHYLAEIQKAEGIASMSRGLSTLLKNMAKGTSNHITLKEEIELVKDYDFIQQVRYMGMYEIIYNIPEDLLKYKIQKFTLQPLVENAIFHGIEPTGKDGTIEISARKDSKYLYVYVKDNGIGIPKNRIKHIFDDEKRDKSNMTGVGIRNINERLKLSYSKECGLFFESEENIYTKATIKLFLEE